MKILVVSDGRRGIENQALGLAEAIERQLDRPCEIISHVIQHGTAFAALPTSFQLATSGKFNLPEADLAIGCGRQAVAPLISLRRGGSSAFTVFVQDPRTEPSRFDLVIAPEHDELDGPFVESMIGSPNRITNDRIVAGTLAKGETLAQLPSPRAMICLGGPSKTHEMTRACMRDHIEAARSLTRKGYSLLVTTSRRTPDEAVEMWETYVADHPAIWLHRADDEAPNPYFAFLGGADIILVTEDSTNMLTEACTTGKPTYRLPMSGGPGKFGRLYERLKEVCGVRLYDGTLDLKDRAPLRETDRVAKRVLVRLEEKGLSPIRS